MEDLDLCGEMRWTFLSVNSPNHAIMHQLLDPLDSRPRLVRPDLPCADFVHKVLRCSSRPTGLAISVAAFTTSKCKTNIVF